MSSRELRHAHEGRFDSALNIVYLWQMFGCRICMCGVQYELFCTLYDFPGVHTVAQWLVFHVKHLTYMYLWKVRGLTPSSKVHAKCKVALEPKWPTLSEQVTQFL